MTQRRSAEVMLGEMGGKNVPIRALCADLIEIAVKDYAAEHKAFTHNWSQGENAKKMAWRMARRWLFTNGAGTVSLEMACIVTGVPIGTVRRWAEHCHRHGRILPLA